MVRVEHVNSNNGNIIDRFEPEKTTHAFSCGCVKKSITIWDFCCCGFVVVVVVGGFCYRTVFK